MFRLNRQNKASKSGERIDFKFSNFQAIQVPKGWDKLFVSMLSVETGKVVAKLGKATVRSGNCQWSETLSESIWFSQDDSSKEPEGSLFKFIVAMGSARSGILGEATVNMVGYVSSKASVPVLLPLQKCNYGTILQVRIQCLPRPKLRDEAPRKPSSHIKYQNADYHEKDGKSSGSDELLNWSGSPSVRDLSPTSHRRELRSQETSFSASGSGHSVDSAEVSIGRENLSPKDELNGDGNNLVGRQDSTSSLHSSPNANFFAEDPPSNHSLINSRVMGSGNDSSNYWHKPAQSAHGIPSSLTNAGSSKNLLEAAEETIEELHAEAKLWERNARKLMLDLDMMRKEFSDQSKRQSEMAMELSAAYTERDGLEKEVEQLKLLLNESTLKSLAMEDSGFQSKGMIGTQKELENEIRFQQESNASLAQQLQRSQESNIELVAVLHELEETIEKQKVEIENLSALQPKFTDMENSIQGQSEENKSLLLKLQQLQESENKLHLDLRLLEQALEDKNNEIEEEKSVNGRTILDIETEYQSKLSANEAKIASLESKLSELLMETELDEIKLSCESEVDLLKENEALKEKLQELERDCDELTNENLELLFKLKNTNLRGGASVYSLYGEFPPESSAGSELEPSKHKSQVKDLEVVLKKPMVDEDHPSSFELSKLLNGLIKQLQITFCQIKKPWYGVSHVNNEREFDDAKLENLSNSDMSDPKGLADSILDSFVGLNQLLEARIIQVEEVLQLGEIDIKERNDDVAHVQKKLEYHISKEKELCLSIQELESSNTELAANLANLGREMAEKTNEIKNLRSVLVLREDEIGFLKQSHGEQEIQVSYLQKEKEKLEENMEAVVRENSITSKCLDDLREDLMVLSTSVDSHVSANKILESKSLELESKKHELELHLVELEEENMQLSGHIRALQTQVGHLTDERECNKLELENSNSLVAGLQDQMRLLGTETTQVTDLTKESLDLKHWRSKAHEECENLKVENQKLLAAVENLNQECRNLQKENENLRTQKLELQEHSSCLAMELEESRREISDYSHRVKALEEDISAVMEDFNLKEKKLTSELNDLLQENRTHKESLILGETLFNQMNLEKTVEVENLKMEIEKLTQQISAIHDEKEKIASEAARTISSLHTTKADLECALEEESQSKVKLMENELNNVRTESELKIQALMVELSASVQNHQKLMADHEKTLKLLHNYRSSEDKLKTALNDVELKFTVSDYECQQLVEEAANLKVLLQKISHLPDENLALKSELQSCKFEKEKLETSLYSVSRDCENLMTEKIACVEKISQLDVVLSELNDCKHKRVALEERLLQMEVDLSAQKALRAQDAELKHELGQTKTAIKQYQWRIQQLEEENEEYMKKTETLGEKLKLIEEIKHDQSVSTSEKANDKYDCSDGSPQISESDYMEKIQLLENELAQALEANNKYKMQLQRFSSEGRNGHASPLKKSTTVGEAAAKERFERTKSSLEAELRDLRERYLHMSLKYAEVEAQREDLVMQLRTAKSGKRWF